MIDVIRARENRLWHLPQRLRWLLAVQNGELAWRTRKMMFTQASDVDAFLNNIWTRLLRVPSKKFPFLYYTTLPYYHTVTANCCFETLFGTRAVPMYQQ